MRKLDQVNTIFKYCSTSSDEITHNFITHSAFLNAPRCKLLLEFQSLIGRFAPKGLDKFRRLIGLFKKTVQASLNFFNFAVLF